MEHGGLGQIAGPHGSGKSTLVAELLSHLDQHFSSVRNIVVRSRKSIVGNPLAGAVNTASSERKFIVIDGIERMSAIDRFALRRYCGRRRFGLLATTHREIPRWPVVFRTEPDAMAFVKIVNKLQSESPAKVELSAIESAFESSDGNIREALMVLYDIWEDRRSYA